MLGTTDPESPRAKGVSSRSNALARLRRSSDAAFSPPRYNRGDRDAQEIQTNHGGHEDEHRGGVRSRRDDGGNHGDNQNRVAEILPEKLRRDDPKQRQKENQDRKLEHQSHAQ